MKLYQRPVRKFGLITLLCLFFLKPEEGYCQNLLLWDHNLSSRIGAENIRTIHGEIAHVGRRILPDSVFENQAFDIAYRLTRTILVTNVTDHLFALSQHEIFGHGARLREFGYTNSSYTIHLIPPYGTGSGMAVRGEPPAHTVTRHEESMILAGGVSGSYILSESIAKDWIKKGEVNSSECLLYVASFHDLTQYILRTGLYESDPSNDIKNYIYVIDPTRNFTDEQRVHYHKGMKKRTLINFLNPLQYAAVWGFATYIFTGNNRVELPFLKVGDVEFMPFARMSLTPFGTEFNYHTHFRLHERYGNIYIRHGNEGTDSWGSGIEIDNVLRGESFTTNLQVHFWSQPDIHLGGQQLRIIKGDIGGALYVSGIMQLFSAINLYSQVGWKTQGFLEGEQLSNGIVIRLGLATSLR